MRFPLQHQTRPLVAYYGRDDVLGPFVEVVGEGARHEFDVWHEYDDAAPYEGALRFLIRHDFFSHDDLTTALVQGAVLDPEDLEEGPRRAYEVSRTFAAKTTEVARGASRWLAWGDSAEATRRYVRR